MKHAHVLGARAAGRGTLTRAIYEACAEPGLTMPQIAERVGAAAAKDIGRMVGYMVSRGYLRRLTRLSSATQRWRGLYVQGASVPVRELPRAPKADSFENLAASTGGADPAVDGAAALRPVPHSALTARMRPAVPELHKAFRMALPHARPSEVRTIRATDSIGAGYFTKAFAAGVACAPMREHRLALPNTSGGLSGGVALSGGAWLE